jgi:hypothetical protein
MNSMRQLGTALFYALVSVVLVVGGLSLAMAEGGLKASSATAQPSPTLSASSTPQPLSSPTGPSAASPTPLVASATQPIVVTQLVTATAQPGTSTSAAIATVYTYPTSTSRVYYPPTPKRCGPYYGWIKAYTVQQGDTLYHISTLYRTTVTELQVANCLAGTFIYPGELLWVPNVPTVTPGVTLIPTFDTPTTEPSSTPEPPTESVPPTATETPVTPSS